MSALSQDADLDSLLEHPFVSGDTSNNICLHNDASASANNEPDLSSSSYDPLPKQQMGIETKPKTTRFWNPFWSSPALLFAFSTVLALLSAATIGLWRFSVSNYGFPLLTAINYSWTYGPTAVLTVIMSIWNQTTYYSKILEPWKQLKLGPLGPEQTLLLDYISPILPVTLWRATRLKHIPVLVTVWTGIVLKVVTVASTGLLSPVNTKMPFQNVSLEALSTFNTKNLHSYYIDTLKDSVINYEAYALMADHLNFPDGIQPDLAFLRFRLPENSTANRTLSTIRATVQSFKPLVQCEDANVVSVNASTETRDNEGFLPRDHEAFLRVHANISWPSCHSSKKQPREVRDSFGIVPTKLPSRQIYGGVPRANLICHDAEESFWNFVTIYDIRYNQTAIPSAIFHAELSNSSGTWGIQIVEATSTACRISYSMVPAQVTYDLSRNPLEPIVELLQDNSTSDSGPFIDGFPEHDFSDRIYNGATAAPFIVGSYVTNGMDEFAPNTFVDMMSRAGNKTPADFLSSLDAMSSAASTIFTYAGVQVANALLISETTEELQGELSTLTMRLQISSLASLAMASGLLIAAISAIVLICVRAQDVVTHPPGPIGSMAMILRDSPSFNVLLSSCGQRQLEHISGILRTFTFQSTTSGTLTGSTSIVPRRQDSVKTELLSGEKVTWWRPLPLHPFIFALISLLPFTVIIALEVLQQLSQRTDGITSILTPDSFLVTLGTRFVPSITFIAIAILYDSIEFNVAMLAAFSRLKAGKAKGKPVITHVLLGRFSLEPLGFSLWNKYWETSFATLAAFLGSFLTIVASGLYTIESLPGRSPVTARRVDRFDPTWSDSVYDDGGAAISLTNFALLNLSFPAWTNSELALPELQLSHEDFVRINASTERSFTIQVPAVRAELQCAITSMEDMSVDVPYADNLAGTLVVNGSTPIPPVCDVGTSTVGWSIRQEIQAYVENPGLLVGQILDLHPSDRNFSFGELTQPLQDNSPPGCPSLAFTFGNYSVQEDLSFTGNGLTAQPTWFTTMSCTQLMAEIQTDVTLSIPDFTVISALPDESTAKYLASGENGQIAFPWRPQLHFALEVIVWDGNITYGGFGRASLVQQYKNYAYEVDGFFSLLLHPSNKVNPKDLLGRNNHDQLLNAIQGEYRRYMAQVANKKMRVPVATNAPPEMYTGTWMDTNRGVLRQDRRSKLALQIILAVMFTCGIASYLLIDTGELLPHDPCSIAGLASLLAGSSICEDHGPIGPQISEGRKVHGSGWEMQKFSLGWWRSSTGGERFGIDIGSATWK